MNKKQKIELLTEKYGELQKEAFDLVGSVNLEAMVQETKLHTIEFWLDCLNVKNIVIHPVETAGTRIVILSSTLYPEFGILVFDEPYLGSRITFSCRSGEDMPSFRLPCGCCSPHLKGVKSPIRNYEQGEKLRAPLARAIRQACEEHEISFLFFSCFYTFGMNPYQDDSPNLMKQDQDGLHLLGLGNSWECVDKPRFATAFKEIVLGDNSHPFEELLRKREYEEYE